MRPAQGSSISWPAGPHGRHRAKHNRPTRPKDQVISLLSPGTSPGWGLQNTCDHMCLCSQEVSLRSAERPAQRPEPALRSESGSLGPLGKAELGVKAESGGPVGGSISSEELGPLLSESTTLRTTYALWVGDRWAPGLDSWCLSSGVKLKLCSHPDTPRTKLVAEA